MGLPVLMRAQHDPRNPPDGAGNPRLEQRFLNRIARLQHRMNFGSSLLPSMGGSQTLPIDMRNGQKTRRGSLPAVPNSKEEIGWKHQPQNRNL